MFPHLIPLAELLTGQILDQEFPGYGFQWTKSQEVDVVVVDFDIGKRRLTLSHVQCIKELQRILTHEVADSIGFRLFLVENMTAPIIETIGRALNTEPDIFGRHMEGLMRLNVPNFLMPRYLAPIKQPSQSSLWREPFFSFSYRRKVPGQIPYPPGRYDYCRGSTTTRGLDAFRATIEQRVSGIVQVLSGSQTRTGRSTFVMSS